MNITVGTSGTGGGFERFCAGETDISDASRAINDEEIAACKAGGVTYQELRVASDGITIVTSANADVGGDNLTLAQLKAIWAPNSKIDNWNQIPGAAASTTCRSRWRAPARSRAPTTSSTRRSWARTPPASVIEPRQDYTASADDNVTVRAVQSAEGGLGYFGYTYFEENQDTLKDFAVDGVKPTAETITDGTYPLSRPLFIYVKDDVARASPRSKAFVQLLPRERDRARRGAAVRAGAAGRRWTRTSRSSAE